MAAPAASSLCRPAYRRVAAARKRRRGARWGSAAQRYKVTVSAHRSRRMAGTDLAAPEHDHARCIDDALHRAAALCARRGARLTELRRRVLELVWQRHAAIKAYDILDELGSAERLGQAAHGLSRARLPDRARPGAPAREPERLRRLPGARRPARGPVPDLRRLRRGQRVRGAGDPGRRSPSRRPGRASRSPGRPSRCAAPARPAAPDRRAALMAELGAAGR